MIKSKNYQRKYKMEILLKVVDENDGKNLRFIQ